MTIEGRRDTKWIFMSLVFLRAAGGAVPVMGVEDGSAHYSAFSGRHDCRGAALISYTECKRAVFDTAAACSWMRGTGQ